MGKIIFKIGGVEVEMEQEEVSKAIEAGTVELSSDELVTYKKEEFETFKTNLSNDEYKKGKTAGEEMLIKTAKEKFELDFEGKTLDNFADAYKTKLTADLGKEPTAKIKELQSDLDKIRGNYSALETDFTSYKGQVAEKETRAKKDNALASYIPSEGLKVGKDITLMALKGTAGIDIDFDDNGNAIVLKNGQVQKNEKTMEPIHPKEFITSQLTSLDLLQGQQTSGRGGGDNTTAPKAGSYEDFTERMKANGIEEGSAEFSQKMQEEIANKTLNT